MSQISASLLRPDVGGVPGGTPPSPPAPTVAAARPKRSYSDAILKFASLGGAVTVLLMLGTLVTVLVLAAVPSIRAFGFSFLTGTTWQPERYGTLTDAAGNVVKDEDGENVEGLIPGVYGAAPVIYGTAVTSAIAVVLAVPLSLGAAVFLIRIAPNWLVPPVSFLIEFLAAIPSIAYGLWGLLVLAPFLADHVEPFLHDRLAWVSWLRPLFYDAEGNPHPLTGRDLLCGGLILAIMIVPIITAISRDVLANVPRAQVEGSVALGATWWQSVKETLKFSRSGLFGAVMLGLARAAGETMAVAKVIGGQPNITLTPFAPAHTMSSILALQFDGATPGTLYQSALLEIALLLLLMSLAFNVVARWLVVGKAGRTAAAH